MAEHNISIVADAGDAAAEECIRAAILAALSAENITQGCDVCVMLTDDEGIHKLNAEQRNVDRPTDVLSFPMLELVPGEELVVNPLELDPETGTVMLGDVVISTERARAQAEEYGHSYERELSFLAVHAVLHLLGYDHEKSAEDEKIHFSRQEKILEDMGIRR